MKWGMRFKEKKCERKGRKRKKNGKCKIKGNKGEKGGLRSKF
jgi:hypothetical protein